MITIIFNNNNQKFSKKIFNSRQMKAEPVSG